MAIGTVGATVTGILTMLANPGLVDVVHTVRTAVLRRRHAQMADGALQNLPRVSLHIGAVEVVVGLEAGILGVLRSVTR